MTAPPRKIGQLLGGKYRIREHLASGGMGVVYAARHEATGRAVALKLLRPELAARHDLAERITREARLAVEASHPNVVQVLDAGADEAGVPYLVLERLYGEPLEALLQQPLPLRTAMQALVPVINALATLHQAGIVHRDLKPSNIFLSREQGGRVTPKLLDFGVAKALEGMESTLTGLTLGTPAYMAPEQVLGCSELSPASDIWSLAVVCVRCLTGRLPFEDAATRGFASLCAGIRPQQLQGVAEPVGVVLARALHWQAEHRPPHALEFRRQLLGALQQVEHGSSWPGEASVSFDPGEDLPRALEGATARHAAQAAAGAALGRPRDALTRTFARVWQTVAVQLWSRRLGRAGLALLAVGVLVALVRAGRPAAGLAGAHGEAEVTRPPALEPLHAAPTTPRPAAGAERSLAQASAQPTSAPPAPELTPTPRLQRAGVRRAKPGHSREAASSGPVGTEAPSSEAPGAEATRAAGTQPTAPEPARAAPLLGANRSPIIE